MARSRPPMPTSEKARNPSAHTTTLPSSAGDVSGTVVIQLDDGHVVSETRAEHEAATGAAADLAPRIHEAVMKAFRGMQTEAIERVRQLLGDMKYIEAAEEALGDATVVGSIARDLCVLFGGVERGALSDKERRAVLEVIITAAGVQRRFADFQSEAAELEALTTEQRLRRHLRLFRARECVSRPVTGASRAA